MNKSVIAATVMLALGLLARDASPQAVQNVVLRNSFNPIGAGARGLGMGGAFIAVADDGTAASFNPAGLAQLRRTEIAAVGFADRLESTFTIPRPGVPEERTAIDEHGAPDFFGIAVPFKAGGKTLTVQLSYQRAVDLYGKGFVFTQDTYRLEDIRPDLELPGVATFVSDVVPSQEGAFHTASVSVAYEATRRLLVGFSFNYWVGEWRAQGSTNFRTLVSLRPGEPAVEFERTVTQFDQDQSLRGLNLNFGVLLRYSKVSLGGAFRLPFAGSYDLTEATSTTTAQLGEEVFTTATFPSARSHLEYPQSVGVGIALRPFAGLTLAADFSQYRWSRMVLRNIPDGALLTPRRFDDSGQVLLPPDSFDRNFFDVQLASQTTTNDTKQWRAGLEYLVSLPFVVVPLRGGVFRDRSPVASIGFGEGRRIDGWTVGTGLNFSHVVFDVAYERRESEGPVGLVFRGGEPTPQQSAPSEKVRDERIVASVIYRFGSDDPITRAFRALFVGETKDN